MRQTFLLLFSLVVVACSSVPGKPNLARLYKHQGSASHTTPIVLIHGVMGGRLTNQSNGNETWPGSLRRILFDDYHALRLNPSATDYLPIASPLQVSGITDKAAGSDFYGRIINVLQEAGGFSLTQINTPVESSERRLYVFAYDWRQDNVHTARALHEFIEQVRQDHSDPELKVDIIAHSMGGLITRYYARYGTQDVLNDNDFPVNNEGSQRIRRVILLGTPNFGSVVAADVLDKGLRIGFDSVAPEVVATFPSTFQVLPHALSSWVFSIDGKPLKHDIYDLEFWRNQQLSIFHPAVKRRIQADGRDDSNYSFENYEKFFRRSLERGRRFSWSLTVTLDESLIDYIVFGGNCSLTPSRMILEEYKGNFYLRLKPNEIRAQVAGVDYEQLMLEPGDGTVSKSSLLARQTIDPTVARHRYSYFPLDYAFFLCEGHQSLTGNISFQDNLLNAILSVDPM